MDLQPKGLDKIPMSTIKNISKELKELDNLHSIKETCEVINAGLFACKLYSQVFEDKKIGLGDLGSVVELLTNLEIFNNAISGIEKVPTELLDKLTEDEIKQITDLFAKYEINFINKKSIVSIINALFNISESVKTIIEAIKYYDGN